MALKALARLNGVLLQQGLAAQARDGRDGEGHAAAANLLSHGDNLCRRVALAHELQNLVAARLQPHIDHRQALVPEGPQLLLRPQADAGGRAVGGDTLALRKQLPNGVENRVELRRLAH